MRFAFHAIAAYAATFVIIDLLLVIYLVRVGAL